MSPEENEVASWHEFARHHQCRANGASVSTNEFSPTQPKDCNVKLSFKPAGLAEAQSKPGIEMVYPEPCKELRKRPQLFLAGTAPY